MDTRIVIVCVLFAISPAFPSEGGQVSPTDATAELLALDAGWQEAVVKGEADFINKRTADDFVFTHWDKTAGDSKADWLRKASAVPKPYLDRKVSNQSAELHGDVALVFGRLDVRTPGDVAPQCYALTFVYLYARRNGTWVFLSHRTTSMLEPPHTCSKR